AVSIGYPGLADHEGPRAEPENLGDGWVGFDFAAAFGRPVKVLNDAVMQAVGSYEGGRMLFLGLGTAVGSALISERTVVPLELGQLPYREGQLADYLGRQGLRRLGQEEWQRALASVTTSPGRAFGWASVGSRRPKKWSAPPNSSWTPYAGSARPRADQRCVSV